MGFFMMKEKEPAQTTGPLSNKPIMLVFDDVDLPSPSLFSGSHRHVALPRRPGRPDGPAVGGGQLGGHGGLERDEVPALGEVPLDAVGLRHPPASGPIGSRGRAVP